MRSIVRCWLAVALLLVVFPSMSWADEPALAKPKDATAADHLIQGNRLYNVRKFEEAAQSYVAGALIEAAPAFDYNLGQCYRQLGRYQEAIWHYKRFLNRGQPSGKLRGFVEGFITQMEAELAKKAASQPPIEPAGPTGGTTQEAKEQPLSAEPGHEHAGSFTTRRKLAIVAWSVGVIGLGGSFGFELSARGNYDDAKAEMTSQDRRDDLYETANDRRRVAVIAGAAGVAAIAGGMFLWFTGQSEDAAFAVAPRIKGESAGLVLSGRF